MIAGSDLIAVQMLSVKFPAEVAVDLLDGDLGRQMTRLPAEISETWPAADSPADHARAA